LAAGPLIVIGAARSGTNLVRAILSAHPAIELQGEPELFLSLGRAGIGPGDVVPREDRVRLLFDLGRTGLTRQHIASLPPQAIEEFLTTPQELGLRELYELLLPRPGDDVAWGEKSLGNAFLMREIAALYPDSVFVHVLRDPRAATWSWVSLHYLDEEREELPLEQGAVGAVAYSAMRWASWTDAIDRASEALPGAAVARVRFEELVADPAAVLPGICARLNLEFDEAMLDPATRSKDPVIADRPRAHRRLAEPVDPARASAGDRLPPWGNAVVERYAAEGMARHGYPSRDETLPREEREPLARELDFIEPILNERLNRDVDRSSPSKGPGAGREPADSLAALAATAISRRGVGTEPKTEVEALRAFAAAALEALEEARASRRRARGPKGERKRRKKAGRKHEDSGL
jgi:hypothetical protein